MSFSAVRWAFEIEGLPSLAKLLLLTLSNAANQENLVWLSKATIMKQTKIHKIALNAAFETLIKRDLIQDTEKRVGRTKNVAVYVVCVPDDPAEIASLEPHDGSISTSTNTAPRNAGCRLKRSGIDRDMGTYSAPEPVNEPIHLETAQSVPVPNSSKKLKYETNMEEYRIPGEWKPKSIIDLPSSIQAIVSYWPAGAYEFQAEVFLEYWTAATGPRANSSNWDFVWHNWIRRARDVTAPPKLNPATFAPVSTTSSNPVYERDQESQPELAMRTNLEQLLGNRPWLGGTALRITAPGVKIFINKPFLIDSAKDDELLVRNALRKLGLSVPWVAFEVGQPRLPRADDGEMRC